tara:strand:+ start:117 stop:1403 length:1287 start_codon:yes stop_codon:yes gene_type:complete
MIKILDSKLSPFGGLHLIHNKLKKKKLSHFIDDKLGDRVKTVGYNYSDILITRIYTSFCGGSATEDVNYIRENTLSHLKNFTAPSADTILRGDIELSTPCDFLKTASGTENKINVNTRMNQLLIGCAKHFDIFQTTSETQDLIYDFDHQFIATEKYDATYSYKKKKGYFPGVVSIGGVPVYIEGRNGNCNVKTEQLPTHQRAIEALAHQGIYPNRVRMDAGSYIKEVVNFFHSKNTLFTIRANQSEALLEAASSSTEWNKSSIGIQDMEVTSLAYLFGDAAHRVVAYRVPNKTKQINAITKDACKYMFIITNDWEINEKQVIEFYNERGASEKIFDIQNNDFNWNCMPHSFLEENTVYLIIMAMAHIIYKWLLVIFSKHLDGLTNTSRLKKFIFRFVALVAKVTRSGRREIIAIATHNKNLIQQINSC